MYICCQNACIYSGIKLLKIILKFIRAFPISFVKENNLFINEDLNNQMGSNQFTA